MTDFTSEPVTGAEAGTSRPDARSEGPLGPQGDDRSWWGEPDPVNVFAAGLELALRQLRVEVAGLRAERDGLRLEVEGLRAKLVLAQEQVVSREGLSDTVRQLQAAVARLTTGEAGGIGLAAAEAPVYGHPAAPAPIPYPVIVLPPAEPIVFAAPPPVVVAPPAPVEPVAPIPTPPAELSAIDQLKAMGVWPTTEADRALEPAAAPTPAAPSAPTPAPEALRRPVQAPEPAPTPLRRHVPVPEPEPELAREPYREPAAKESVVNWDKMSTRRAPVLLDDGRARFDVPDDLEDGTSKRSKLRLLLTAVMSLIGAVVVLTVLAVSVGPRILPYQTYFVRSGSMEPTISTGAMVVLTKTDAEKLGPGDIITFNKPDDESVKVTHRIVEIETTDQGRVFVTKGDANGDVDSWRVPASGTGWKYAFNIPIIGFVFGYLGTPQARIALLVIPALVLGLLALLDIWKPKDKKKR